MLNMMNDIYGINRRALPCGYDLWAFSPEKWGDSSRRALPYVSELWAFSPYNRTLPYVNNLWVFSLRLKKIHIDYERNND